MTTIVMIESSKGVDIAYDSLCTAGSSVFEIENRKVFKSGAMLIGVAGSISDLVTIEATQFPEPPDNSKHVDRWVVNTHIPELRATLEAAGRMGDEDGKKASDSLVLAVIHGRVYDIDADFAWTRRTDGNYIVGSGASFALGAISAGATAIEAVRIAALHDGGTGGTLREMTVER